MLVEHSPKRCRVVRKLASVERLADVDTGVGRDRGDRLGPVAGQDRDAKSLRSQELHRLGLAQHVVAHGLVHTGEGTQLVDPVRIGQEAQVEHEVGRS